MSRQSRKKSWKSIAFAVAMILLLYVLSFGPVWWVVNRFDYGQLRPILAPVYLPLIWAAIECPPLGSFLDWYFGLWVPK
ncbi:MAG TPA: hypothetical protein VG055_19455 [Planctomycetaceae bacterium]|jgi:hypothetical protein|nr:hypothetical protein [Planctomycetaceae bacterium]